MTRTEAVAALGLSVRRLQQLCAQGVIHREVNRLQRGVQARYRAADVRKLVAAREAAWTRG